MIKVLTFDQALAKTVYVESDANGLKRTRAQFQVLTVVLLCMALMAKYPVVAGLSFLEKIPPKLECLQFSASKMHSIEHVETWKSCTQQEICALKLSKNQYRPVTTESEYFDNWVPKFDLMCRPANQIGLLGSCFFIGILAAMFFVPRGSDLYGRLPFIYGSLIL